MDSWLIVVIDVCLNCDWFFQDEIILETLNVWDKLEASAHKEEVVVKEEHKVAFAFVVPV